MTEGGSSSTSTATRRAAADDLAIVASWIGTREECRRWAGPRVSYPIEPKRLREEIEMAAAVNVALVDGDGLAAFGQAVPRGPERAHLARVVVRPDARGRGLGRALVEVVLARAAAAGFRRVTLYVCSDNVVATRLYTRLGFVRADPPPEDPPLPDVWFMQRSAGRQDGRT